MGSGLSRRSRWYLPNCQLAFLFLSKTRLFYRLSLICFLSSEDIKQNVSGVLWCLEERVVITDKSSVWAPSGARSHYGQELGLAPRGARSHYGTRARSGRREERVVITDKSSVWGRGERVVIVDKSSVWRPGRVCSRKTLPGSSLNITFINQKTFSKKEEETYPQNKTKRKHFWPFYH